MNSTTPTPAATKAAPDVFTPDPNAPSSGAPPPTELLSAMRKAMAAESTPAAATPPPAAPDPAAKKDDAAPAEPAKDKDYNWNKLKAEREAEAKRAEAAERKLKEFEAKYASNDYETRLKQLSKERDELSTRLERVAVEHHPKFQAKYVRGIESIAESVKAAAGPDLGDKLAKIIKSGDIMAQSEVVDEMIADLPQAKQSRILAQLNKAADLYEERSHELTRAQEQLRAMKQEEEQQMEAIKSKLDTVFTEALEDARKTSLDIFKRRDNDPEWNKEVEQVETRAREIFSGQLDPKEIAVASTWAAAGPKLYEMLLYQMELNSRREKQLAEYKGASPNPASPSNTAAAVSAQPAAAGGSEFVNQVMAAIRGAR